MLSKIQFHCENCKKEFLQNADLDLFVIGTKNFKFFCPKCEKKLDKKIAAEKKRGLPHLF